MQCPLCGAAGLIRDTREITYCYRGAEIMIHDITGAFCIECKEMILDEDNAEKFTTAVREYKQTRANFRFKRADPNSVSATDSNDTDEM